ncbi:AaceriAAR017Wp [[Ashbya] aceris (nom. inval.)]|nr:AaceriAAR017Wp [[Ashbya] aceris (nom. inval.)]
MLEKIYISQQGEFTDDEGNVIQLRGVNVDPSVKFPQQPRIPTNVPVDDNFWDEAADVSFVNERLQPGEIEEHISRLKALGYNCIRYLFTWEALEHGGPGIYDEEYMKYTVMVLKKIKEAGGMYVYLDPHQDVWSRFSGGSGAPLWTLHCAGFQPKRFLATEAAILHNYYIDSETRVEKAHYPEMIWSTNYYRLACQTMFTLFFSGKEFAPKCVINGRNIQDYLQGHFLKAVMTFYKYIQDNAPELFEENCIIGLETMNEPNCGYLDHPNLAELPRDRQLMKGTTPTAYQSFIVGEGFPCNIDSYDITLIGARKMGKSFVDPKGKSAWLDEAERQELDHTYAWTRADDWTPGCIWRLHGVWGVDPKSKKPTLLRPAYFSKCPSTGEATSMSYFTNKHFLDFYVRYRNQYRQLDPENLLFLEPPVLQEPPYLIGSDIIDNRTVYACHFYDGMSLMFKSWNRRYNVDTFGFMRGKYLSPIFGLVFGEVNIKRCFRRQLRSMKLEGKRFLGNHVPIFFTEIGMPYDMEGKKAYKDDDYSSQIGANDALGFALEGSNMSFSLWCYTHINNNTWGDNWNREDFSIWNQEYAMKVPRDVVVKTADLMPNSSVNTTVGGSSDMTTESRLSNDAFVLDYSGFRALDAILRPFPVKIHGSFSTAEFDLERKRYFLEIIARTETEGTSFIFLPYYHFPPESTVVSSSSGYYVREQDDQQILKWCHSGGRQYISIEVNGMGGSSSVSTPDSSCLIM